jgi:hypothetical protein
MAKNGFSLIKNFSMSQFIEKLGKGGLESLISQGMAYAASKNGKDNNLRDHLQNPLQRVMQNKESIKKEVNRISTEEKKIDESN